jgi:hypothetical protein
MLFVTGLHATILAGLQGWLFGRLWAARIVPLVRRATGDAGATLMRG